MNLFKLKERRINQLQEENEADQKLKTAAKLCPDVVLHFLFKVREINRYQADLVYSSSFIDFPQRIEESLQSNQLILDEVNKMTNEDLCKLLR
jgi:hypothetical protein